MENKAEKISLFGHYSNEICSHVEAVVSLFFGAIGNLIIMQIVNTFAARIVFSVTYFFLGFLGVYFYARLFYYRKLLEGILLEEPYKNYHIRLQNGVFKKSKIISYTQMLSRTPRSGYRLTWAWIMLSIAIIAAISSWAIVFFSL